MSASGSSTQTWETDMRSTSLSPFSFSWILLMEQKIIRLNSSGFPLYCVQFNWVQYKIGMLYNIQCSVSNWTQNDGHLVIILYIQQFLQLYLVNTNYQETKTQAIVFPIRVRPSRGKNQTQINPPDKKKLHPDPTFLSSFLTR